MSEPITRRRVLRRGAQAGAAALVADAALAGAPGWARLVDRAAHARPAGSDLGAIEHIVILVMENRSYDCYFGAYPRGRGFNDHPRRSLGRFAQDWPDGTIFPKGKLLPFRLDQQCQNDPTHNWGPQHLAWNGGRMDSWVKVHTSSTYEGSGGVTTMGYYERADIPFLYALADHFTLCDHYFCSVLGPTHPNRLMQMSGTIDPDGRAGGPITDTNFNPDVLWSCHWTTMPEVLEEAGVSWKVYTPSNAGVSGKYAAVAGYESWNPAFYNPTTNPEALGLGDGVLPYFAAYQSPASSLYQKAFLPTFPNNFAADVNGGTLPSVSWVIPPIGWDEHPSSSPARGNAYTAMVLDALVQNPAVWSKTALFLTYDENGGFFDHVSPPVPRAGTPGEHLTAPPRGGNPTPDTLGITTPIGLGPRVPALMISPFSRGGHIASETFDHTSTLKLIAKRFGVGVPNLSAWRARTVGDLESTLFRSRADATPPKLPPVVIPSTGACSSTAQDSELGGAATAVPAEQRMPRQGGGSVPASYYFGKPRRPAKRRRGKR